MYSIGVNGALTSIGSAVAAGTNPFGIACDSSGKYVYAVNYGAATASMYVVQNLDLTQTRSISNLFANRIFPANAANPVQFAAPTPVAVATVTATAVPGLTTTFRGCIEVQGSDGSYGRFQLPQGSTTSALVYGSATVSAGVPASTKWGIDYSSGWRYNNQTAGAITFTLIQVLTGIA